MLATSLEVSIKMQFNFNNQGICMQWKVNEITERKKDRDKDKEEDK